LFVGPRLPGACPHMALGSCLAAAVRGLQPGRPTAKLHQQCQLHGWRWHAFHHAGVGLMWMFLPRSQFSCGTVRGPRRRYHAFDVMQQAGCCLRLWNWTRVRAHAPPRRHIAIDIIASFSHGRCAARVCTGALPFTPPSERHQIVASVYPLHPSSAAVGDRSSKGTCMDELANQ
jgi:hypothetical protein